MDFRLAGRLHGFVWIDSGHGIQLDLVSEVWLLQDWMGTSVGGVNPVALNLPAICQVSFPLSGPQFLLAWFQSGSHFGQELLYLFSIAHRFTWLICFRHQRIHSKMQARPSRAVAQDLKPRLLDRCGLVQSERDSKASKLDIWRSATNCASCRCTIARHLVLSR